MKTKQAAQNTQGPGITPGKWRFISWGQTISIDSKDGYTGIANINPGGNHDAGIPSARDVANAALIAAAPELLSKLKEVVRSADMTVPGKVFVTEFIESCRAAIAKAEGGK